MSRTFEKNKSLWQLYRISKYVYNESFLEGNLSFSGPQKDRFVEKMKRNTRSLKSNAIIVKAASAILILFLSIMRTYPYKTIMLGLQNVASLTSAEFNNYLISLSLGFTFILIFELIFLFTYGMTGMMGLFSGKAFNWLEVLPFRKSELNAITFFTFFRSLNYQFIAILIGLPLGIIVTIGFNIYTILPILVSLGISVLSVMFFVGFMAVVSNFMAKKIFNLSGTSKWRSFLQTFVSVSYVIVMIAAVTIVNMTSMYASTLIQAGQSSSIINAILSFVVFPFSLSNLLSLFFMPIKLITMGGIYPILIGFLFSIFIIVLIFRKGINTLRKLTKESEFKVERAQISIESIKVIKKPPITAMFKKDLSYVFRNFGVTMYFIMPIIFPCIMLFAIPANISDIPFDPVFFLNFMILVYIGFCLVFGLIASTSGEGDTGNILATLPTKNYHIYKSKRRTVFLIMFLSLITPMIVIYIKYSPDLITLLVDFAALAILYFALSELILILYSAFFGKVHNKYTMDNIHPDLKIIKSIGGVVIIYIVSYGVLLVALFLQALFFFNQPQMVFYILLVLSIIVFIPVRIIAKYMFDR